jgi:hypothetical protein
MRARSKRREGLTPTVSTSRAGGAEPDLAELRAAFPDWNIWASDKGHWYATHRGSLHPHAPLFGLWPMVDGADLAVLRAELTLQALRASSALNVTGDRT